MTNAPITWIECPAWELDFFSLPHRIPWPANVPVEDANKQPFEAGVLLDAIELLEKHDPVAAQPWLSFARAADGVQELNEALQESEYVQAAELLEKFEQAHPGTAFSAFHRAFLARQNGRDDEALGLYQMAAQKAPRIGFIWSHVGGLLGEAGRRDEALAALKNALQLNPQDPLALEGMVQLRAAVKLFKDPKDPKSAVYFPIEQYRSMAAQQIDQLAKDPDQLVGFGEHQLREALIPEVGVRALEKALELRPTHPRTMVALGAAYRMTGQHERAIEMLRRVTEIEPQNPWNYFHLAQAFNAVGDKANETATLDRALEIEPNFQPAIGARFGIDPANPSQEIEERIGAFAAERKSWMAFLVASSIARDRRELAASQRWAARAFELNPNAEDVLLHYASVLADNKDAAAIDEIIAPAVRMGKYSKRLDWNFAQALRALGRTNEAIAVLRDAAAARDAQQDFKNAAAIAIDFWNNLIAESREPIEIHRAGALRRPILLTLDDGDGGVILGGARPLPAEHRFTFRTAGTGDTEARVRLQQGQSGSQPGSRALGVFTISGIRPAVTGPTTIDCYAGATREGTLRLGAMQDGRKLKVEWMA